MKAELAIELPTMIFTSGKFSRRNFAARKPTFRRPSTPLASLIWFVSPPKHSIDC